MAAMPVMPAFQQDHAWNRSNVVLNQEPAAPKTTGKRGRKGPAISSPTSKPKTPNTPKDSSRSERSLGMLTKQFIHLLKEENGTLDLNMTADKLKVQKRRIYDITNVLEGIDLIEKFKKNNVRWKGVTSTSKSTTGCRQAASGINRQKRDDLLQEKTRLEQEHNRLVQMRAQVDGAIKDTLTNENTARYAYVTMEDIKKVDSLQDSLVLAVSTPYETYMQLDDRSTDPSQPFVMNLEHKTAAGDVNFSTFVVPPRCPGSPFLSSDSSTEGSTDYSSLDDYSSSESSTDESDYSSSSSSDDYSDDSSDCSSSSDEDDEESTMPLRKTLIGNHAIISNLPQQDIVTIYSVAMDEKEAEYMSE
ncbi:E2F transcription factor 3 [Linnemannia exigua]|uniref:E2F transcription factor 3 n=1 Tax=Linnemannia exigua TaxID=604196 RepID=A0AAD4D3Y4_9FUNG|nr:E2F transcription factor 3 [Linnemannia exigua]